MAAIELPALEMGEVGKGTYCEVWVSMAKEEIQGEPEFILSLDNCASVGCN
jgi:hypothetical protein